MQERLSLRARFACLLLYCLLVMACAVEVKEGQVDERQVESQAEVAAQTQTLTSSARYVVRDGRAIPAPGFTIYRLSADDAIVVPEDGSTLSGGKLTLSTSGIWDHLKCEKCGDCEMKWGLGGSVYCKGSCSGFAQCALYSDHPFTGEVFTVESLF